MVFEPSWRVLLSDGGVKQISCPESKLDDIDATAKRLKLRHQARIAGTRTIARPTTYHITDCCREKRQPSPSEQASCAALREQFQTA